MVERSDRSTIPTGSLYQQMPRENQPNFALRRLFVVGVATLGLMFSIQLCQNSIRWQMHRDPITGFYGTIPLVMKGGDPYIRALMRTISASESNVPHPYSVIYGGEQVSDLRRHPERCITIVTGPNKGNCSTAAGRYQMLNRTWKTKAKRYHPKPDRFLVWTSYSFEPEYQDAVVYAWLKDRKVWGVDISKLLKQGKLEQVLQLLSGTWTSLGYGIETNSMSRKLPNIYQKMLEEELKIAG